MSTAVRRTRLEKSTGRVKRIRKIHGRLSVPLQRRQSQIAHASVSKANHCGVAITGLIETQLQQSWSQVASCLAKRLRGRSATMVLMTAGNELDLVFYSSAPVIALTHALWDGWMPLATMAECIKAAQTEERESAQPQAVVIEPFGAVVATLKRLQ